MATLQGKRLAQDQHTNINPGKRPRNDDLSFAELLEECGCQVPDSPSAQEYLVEDPRKLRRSLEQRLTLNEALRRKFLDGVRDHLDPPQVLHAALRPMEVTGATAFITGDSLVRALLNIPCLQRDLSEYLLQRIPEFSSDADAMGDNKTSEAQLILGQFRWLDCLSDPHAVTATLLEVLPAMQPEAQRDAITVLPEIAPEDDHASVLDALESLVSDGPEFLIPSLEAASNLALNEAGQARVTEMVASRLQSVDVEDLPAVVRHLLQGAATSDTFSTLRQALHFVAPEDPRLAVPDRKGKGKIPPPGEDPESQVLAAMRQALQFGKGAADAVLKALKGITEPENHSTFDLWVMLAMVGLGPDRRHAVHALLRKKFAEGHAEPSWLERSVVKHSIALTEQFSPLLALAQHLLSDTASGVAAAGAALFVTLFAEFDDAYCRQEVLRALHSHLGAAATAEAAAALGVLQRLAHERTAHLMQYAAFLTNILDYVTRYNADQLTAAFDVFAELVVGACQSEGAAAGGTGGGLSLSQGGGGGGRSRMEDELFIFLRKQLSGAFPSHRRVGAVGVVALVQRLGKEMEEHGGGTETLLAQRYREARALLDSTLTAAASCPDTLSYLCDALATEAQRGTLPRSLMESLRDTLSSSLEAQFIVGLQEWTQGGEQEAWWNINGDAGDVVVTLLPPPGSNNGAHGTAGGTVSNLFSTHQTNSAGAGVIATLFPTLRAVAALNIALCGNLQAVDALLGCPLGMFPLKNASPRAYAALDPAGQREVLLGLFYALNWCRELVNAFAMVAGGPITSQRQDARGERLLIQMQMSLMLRVRAASQLEAALAALLPAAPPQTTLPALGPAAASAGDAGAGPGRKAAAGGKKKAATKVKFKQEPGTTGGGGAGADSTGTAPVGSDGPNHSAGSGQATNAGAHGTAAGLANTQGDLVLPAAERLKLRALAPSSLAALNAISRVEGQDGACFSSLPATAYLLSDVVEKTRNSLAQPKRAPFMAAAPKSAAIPASTLLAALCPALPALRHHLDTANRLTEARQSDDVIKSDDEQLLRDFSVTPCSSPLLAVLPDCPAAKRAVSPTSAATRVTAGVLECMRLLLSFHEIATKDRRSALQVALAAFGPLGATSPAAAAPAGGITPSTCGSDASFVVSQWGPAQFMEGCTQAFKYFLQLAADEAEEESPTAAEMSRWPAVLAVLEALVKVGEQLAADHGSDPKAAASWAKRLALMRQKLSKSAALMLQQHWPVENDDGSEMGAAVVAGGWKKHTGPLAEAIRIAIVYSTQPLQKVEAYVSTGLMELSPAPTGKENSEPLEDLPSLSGVTIGTWYKCLWDVLQNQWKNVTAAAKSSGKTANAAPEAAAAIATGISECCAAFNSVVAVVKLHDRRAVVLNAAAKGGGVFIEGVLRVMPFWKEVFPEHRTAVIDSIKVVQKATRNLNSLCAEGKVRADMNVVIRVSRLKKAIESFINESYLLLRHRAPELVVLFGELKHRDLQGNALETSQMYPGADEGEEERFDEGEEEEEEEIMDYGEDEAAA